MDDFGPFLVPLGMFAMIVAIVWVVQNNIAKNRSAYLTTVRAAIERGVELSPETIKALGAPTKSRYGDLRSGAIWIAVAAACLVFGWAVEDEADFGTLKVFIGFAAFPGFIGLALIGFGIASLWTKD